MAFLKRISLFLITNLLIVLTISIVLNILGVRPYLTRAGLDYGSLATFCLVWGMGGAIISLAMSRWMAKWQMGVQVIDPNRAGEFAWLVNMVHQSAKRANLPAMPEVGVFPSPTINAFATGPTKSRALVAVSTGTLSAMDRGELEGIIGHEITHIQNGDMVTMALLQGVVNAFVMFLARAISFALSQGSRDSENRGGNINYLVVFLLEIVLGFLGMMVVGYFSRQREFRADKGGAILGGRENMTRALQKLAALQGAPVAIPASMAPYQISGKQGRGLSGLFSMSTHPPLADRIQALQQFRG